MNAGERVRVLIVDDDALVRSGLRLMLAGSDRVEVVAEADDGSEVLASRSTPTGVRSSGRATELVAGGDGASRLSPAVARRLIEHVAAEGPPARRRAGERRPSAPRARSPTEEREVAEAIGQGKSNADIAAELYMSVATVKAHVTRVLSKLDADNRVQIALLVQDARL